MQQVSRSPRGINPLRPLLSTSATAAWINPPNRDRQPTSLSKPAHAVSQTHRQVPARSNIIQLRLDGPATPRNNSEAEKTSSHQQPQAFPEQLTNFGANVANQGGVRKIRSCRKWSWSLGHSYIMGSRHEEIICSGARNASVYFCSMRRWKQHHQSVSDLQ